MDLGQVYLGFVYLYPKINGHRRDTITNKDYSIEFIEVVIMILRMRIFLAGEKSSNLFFRILSSSYYVTEYN